VIAAAVRPTTRSARSGTRSSGTTGSSARRSHAVLPRRCCADSAIDHDHVARLHVPRLAFTFTSTSPSTIAITCFGVHRVVPPLLCPAPYVTRHRRICSPPSACKRRRPRTATASTPFPHASERGGDGHSNIRLKELLPPVELQSSDRSSSSKTTRLPSARGSPLRWSIALRIPRRPSQASRSPRLADRVVDRDVDRWRLGVVFAHFADCLHRRPV